MRRAPCGGRRARDGRAGVDAGGPAGGLGAEWGMAGARGPTRRQLVARGQARRRRTGFAIDPVRARRVALWLVSAVGAALVLGVGLPWVAGVARRHPYFAVREVALRHRGELEPDTVRALS